MEEIYQLVLALFFGDFLFVAQAGVLVVSDKVFVNFFELFFYLEPGEWEKVVNIVKFDLFTDDNDGRVAAEALDELEPVFNPVFVFAGAAVAGKDIQAALGEEKLVSRMVDFLTAEVLHV